MLARELRARGGFGVLLEIKTTRLRRVVSQVRRGSCPGTRLAAEASQGSDRDAIRGRHIGRPRKRRDSTRDRREHNPANPVAQGADLAL